jgi:hypothetical protein
MTDKELYHSVFDPYFAKVHADQPTDREIREYRAETEARHALEDEQEAARQVERRAELDAVCERHRDQAPSYSDCYPDPWADDYAAIIAGEL